MTILLFVEVSTPFAEAYIYSEKLIQVTLTFKDLSNSADPYFLLSFKIPIPILTKKIWNKQSLVRTNNVKIKKLSSMTSYPQQPSH